MEPNPRPASGISLLVKTPHGLVQLVDPPEVSPAAPGLLPADSRRPVVALLDSAVRSHPWLLLENESPWWDTLDMPVPPADLTSPQASAIKTVPETDVFEDGAAPVQEPWQEHGTFNAGLVRKLAPDAKLLSVPLMGTSGEIRHEVVRRALAGVLNRVTGPDPEGFVDVVCLPFGYLAGTAPIEHQLAERSLLHALAALGVIVVASAGNFGADTPVYPAAFAPERPPAGPALVSVGALDHDAPAAYSSFGDWVTHWEPGTDVVSVVSDPKDGFARGRGTSFAAAGFAGRLVAALSTDMVALADTSPAAAIARAESALEQVSG